MSTFPDPANPTPSSGVVARIFQRVHERLRTRGGEPHDLGGHVAARSGGHARRHDRYAASKRNPYNEIECGDHYARAMASYGTHIAVCGYEYHGPKGYLAFSPKLTPENFRAAFTAAQGWGAFTQQRNRAQQTHIITIKSGQLVLQTLAFDVPATASVTALSVTLNGAPVSASMSQSGNRITVTLSARQTIPANQNFVVQFSGTGFMAGFTIQQGTVVNNAGVKSFQVTWASLPGESYAIEYSDSPAPANWLPLATNVTASAGATTTFSDLNLAGSRTRFYRIQLSQ